MGLPQSYKAEDDVIRWTESILGGRGGLTHTPSHLWSFQPPNAGRCAALQGTRAGLQAEVISHCVTLYSPWTSGSLCSHVCKWKGRVIRMMPALLWKFYKQAQAMCMLRVHVHTSRLCACEHVTLMQRRWASRLTWYCPRFLLTVAL